MHSEIHDVGSVGNMVYFHSANGVMVVGCSRCRLASFVARLFAPSSPECSMVDAPWRPECRTCWQRLGGENAMGNRKGTCMAFRGVWYKRGILVDSHGFFLLARN